MKLLRSIFSYLLLLSLLLGTAGVSVNKHYCGDFLASFSFYTPADDCSADGEEDCEDKGMDCCEDESEFFIADLDPINKAQQQSFQLVPNFFLVSNTTEIKTETIEDKWLCSELVEPPNYGPPIYLANSQLTYYG